MSGTATIAWSNYVATPQCSNVGTVSGVTSWVADVPTAYAANVNSLSFTNGKILLLSAITLANGDSLSIFFNGASAFNFQMIGGNNSNSNMQISVADNTRIYITNDASTVSSFTFSLSTSTWYNLIITRSADVAHAYLNGVESVSGGQALTGTVTIDVLGNNAANVPWDGKLSEFRLFHSVLTPTDISNIQSGIDPVSTSYLHWKINEGAGTNIICYGS